MAKFLQSGRRRDACVLLAGAGELTSQRLKTRLERHYDARIDPKSFRGTLRALADDGFVERRADGVADVYSLTDAGERRLREHVAWVSDHVAADDAADADDAPESDGDGTEEREA